MNPDWSRLRPLFAGRKRSAVTLVSASVVAGLAEAAVLTLLAEVAAAMVTHAHHIGAQLGPVNLSLGLAKAMSAVMQIITALSGGAMFFALVIAAFAVNPLVAFIILCTAIVLFGLMRPIARRGRRSARELSQASMNHAAGVSEVVRLGEE